MTEFEESGTFACPKNVPYVCTYHDLVLLSYKKYSFGLITFNEKENIKNLWNIHNGAFYVLPLTFMGTLCKVDTFFQLIVENMWFGAVKLLALGLTARNGILGTQGSGSGFLFFSLRIAAQKNIHFP